MILSSCLPTPSKLLQFFTLLWKCPKGTCKLKCNCQLLSSQPVLVVGLTFWDINLGAPKLNSTSYKQDSNHCTA